MDRRAAILGGFGTLVAIRRVTAQQSNAARPLIPAPYLQPTFLAPRDAAFSIAIHSKNEPGARLIVTWRVMDGMGTVAGASIYVAITARLYGFMRSDANGQYRFETSREADIPE